MAKNKILFATLSTIFSGCVLAGTMGPVEVPTWRKVVGLSIGPAWTKSGETETFSVDGTDPLNTYNAYVALQKNSTFGFGELFLGMQHNVSSNIIGQLGLVLGGTTDAKITGEIWADADPRFDNFFYNYKVSQLRLAVKGKLIADMGMFASPYVSGSVGAGWNRAHDFYVTPKILAAVPFVGFASNTTTSFTYTLGIGLQKAFNENWSAGIGYQFADLGKTRLGRMPNQNINDGLHLNHIYTNGVEFNLSYIV